MAATFKDIVNMANTVRFRDGGRGTIETVPFGFATRRDDDEKVQALIPKNTELARHFMAKYRFPD